MKRYVKATCAAIVVALGGASVQAASTSFRGNLAGDDAVQLFSFTLGVDSGVTLRTWSYAGGSNAAGNLIGAGGFDPIVSLFYGSGGSALLIGANDDGVGVAVDPVTGAAHDSLLDIFALSAGTYTVALTQFANSATGPSLADGFDGGGIAGFDGRSSAWALDILGITAATAIPEPSALMLALLGLAVLGADAASMRRLQSGRLQSGRRTAH